jgi:hypothetical protein
MRDGNEREPQIGGHITSNYPLRETLYNSSLADSRLANEHGIVLRSS